MDTKRLAAEKAVEYIEHGMIIGLGTGSTAYWAIQKIGEQVKKGLAVKAVATSLHTETMARELGTPIAPFSAISHIDLAIDGADEVDSNRNLIKGGGGALLREKIVAYNSNRFVVVVDESKLVEHLGKFPLPVELLPFGAELTVKQIEKLGARTHLRQTKEDVFITDNGNYIADCDFYPISDPAVLNAALHAIPGVVETGLFLQPIVSSIVVGRKTGAVSIIES